MNDFPQTSFIDRTVQNLRAAWKDIADITTGILSTSPNSALTGEEAKRVQQQLRDCLQSRGGEVSARARAANLGRTYLSLNPEGRKRFLQILARDFDVDREKVNDAAMALRNMNADEATRRQGERVLREALDPPRLHLLTQFNALPEGIKFLVELRAELLHWRNADADLAALEIDLKGLLTSWFDVGFLNLRQIDWDSPASLLEKLIAYEAVHAIKGWDDLKHRLGGDRRCFAFFHPRMPDEPLIFVQVALTDKMAESIQHVLDEQTALQHAHAAKAAIFYSISNAQIGLSGISFGSFLIKRVVDVLASEFEGIKIFATLSPIPGFRAWLDIKLEGSSPSSEAELLTPAERKRLAAVTPDASGNHVLKAALALPDWEEVPAVSRALKAPLLRLCARYITEEKRDDGSALDRVAHFHLSNGARVERLNWLGDRSANGLAQSAGIMVNYLYKLDDIEANHEAYKGEGRVSLSSGVRSLIRS